MLCFVPNEKAGVGLGNLTSYIGPGLRERGVNLYWRAMLYAGAFRFVMSKSHGAYGPALALTFIAGQRNPLQTTEQFLAILRKLSGLKV